MPRPRPLIDAALVVVLVLMLATGLPSWLPGVHAVDRLVDPLADVTGLQQANWQLFAPEPDQMNAWIEARVTFSDGSVRTVASPDWRDRTLAQKLVQGRWPKVIDYARRDDWKGLWDPYAAWVARTTPRPERGVRPVEVELIRHWWNVPPPSKLAADHARWGAHVPPRDAYPHRFAYHTWRATP